jgi:hypothetical protein
LPAFVEVILGLIPIVILAFFIRTTVTITKRLGRIEDLLGEIRDQLARRDSAAD